MTEDILRIREFEPSMTEYSKMETNNFGGKKMWVNYKGRKSFKLQLPRMEATFGLSDFTDQTTGKTKYYLNLSFKKDDVMKGVLKMFHGKLQAWDEKVIEDASLNTVNWFKKPAAKLTKNVIKKNYTPMLSRFKDKTTLEFTGEHPDKLKLKVPFWDGKFTVEVFDENQNPVDVSYITPHCEVVAVIKSANVWFTGDKFGVSLNSGVLQIFPAERLSGYSFLPDLENPEPSPAAPVVAAPLLKEEDDEEDLDNAPVAAPEAPVKEPVKEESESEESESEEEAKEEPKKAESKKAIVEASEAPESGEKKKRARPTARTAAEPKAKKATKAVAKKEESSSEESE